MFCLFIGLFVLIIQYIEAESKRALKCIQTLTKWIQGKFIEISKLPGLCPPCSYEEFLNQRDELGNVALHFAAESESMEIILLLIRSGSSLHLQYVI